MQFIDLQAQYLAYRQEIDQAMRTVCESARFINGPQVKESEEALAQYVGTRHAVGYASGTEGLKAVLMAWDIGPGDEVITTPFTFFATTEVIAVLGARPVFVDLDPETLNIDPDKIEAAITPRTKAIMPVSLYGQCADLDAINAIAQRHNLLCLEDACQSMGAQSKGRRSCSMTDAAVTSFFPAKPLGCFGDGGMVFTNNSALDTKLRVIREHGQSARYLHTSLGLNGRLDTLQAAILLAKLPHFDSEIAARQRVAAGYRQRLEGVAKLPIIRPDQLSVYAQFTVRIPNRDRVAEQMQQAGIPTAIHYPLPVHRQPVFASSLGNEQGAFPIAEQAASEVLSLPMHPFLTPEQQDQVAAALITALKATQ